MKIHMPDPASRAGALFYSVFGAAIVASALMVGHHIHVIWS